jgi:hypothetical protein
MLEMGCISTCCVPVAAGFFDNTIIVTKNEITFD